MNHVSIFVSILLMIVATISVSAEDRTYDGYGNNLANPNWGVAQEQFRRLDAVHYSDMTSAPARPNGPNPRQLSHLIGSQNGSVLDANHRTDFVWQWGQFVDHDIVLTDAPRTEPLPIMVTDTADPLYPMIPMFRSDFDSSTGTDPTNPRQQRNSNTAYLDASMIYGSNSARAAALRANTGGRMATSHAGTLLPYNTNLLPNANDSGIEPDHQLFLAGDVRANEQLGLISMHTLFVREHNRLATQLAADNPTWSDEQLYQRARKIVNGIVQNITYQEYLPALLGSDAPSMTNAAYDPTTDATLSNEFATTAFRLGHTQVSPFLQRLNHDGSPAAGGAVALKDAFFSPSHFTSGDEVDFLLLGLANQVQQATDTQMIGTLRNAMFGGPGSGGLDLFSINIQRSRDHGLGSFTDLQQAIGVTPAISFADITSDTALQAALAAAFGDVTQVNMWVGMLAEDIASDGALGPTMTTVVSNQFTDLMYGDRFFFMWDDDLSATELQIILDSKLSDVILRNTGIETLRSNVFFVPEPSHHGVLLLALLAMMRRRSRSQRSR